MLTVTLWTGFKLTANTILADSCPCSSEKRNTGVVSCEWKHATLVWQERDVGVVVSTNIFLPLHEMVGVRTHMWAGVLTSEVLVWNKMVFWINACYLIAHHWQNRISHGMQKNLFFYFSPFPPWPQSAVDLLLFIGSVIPKWFWWDVIWRLPELCQDAFGDGSPSSVGLCLPGEYLPSAFSKYGTTLYFGGRLDIIMLLCWSMMRKQCDSVSLKPFVCAATSSWAQQFHGITASSENISVYSTYLSPSHIWKC